MLDSFFKEFKLPFSLPNPPEWAIEETQRRLILLINHVLMQEPQATARLARQKSRRVLVQWQAVALKVQITPAGLLDLAPASDASDLVLTLTDPSPLSVVQGLAQGSKPAVRVEGDVQLAAEVNWLTDHLRWDLEADLARILGDVAAHLVVANGRKLLTALQEFAARGGGKSAQDGTGASPPAPFSTESAP